MNIQKLDNKASHAHFQRKVILKIHKMYIVRYGYRCGYISILLNKFSIL